MSIVADRRLYLNKDKTRVVEEGDPDAAYLYKVPGHVITEEDAIKFNLYEEDEPEPIDDEYEEEGLEDDLEEDELEDDLESKMMDDIENK